MSLGWVIVFGALSFCAGVSAMLWAQGSAEGWQEDIYFGRALWAGFTVATVAVMALGAWFSQ